MARRVKSRALNECEAPGGVCWARAIRALSGDAENTTKAARAPGRSTL